MFHLAIGSIVDYSRCNTIIPTQFILQYIVLSSSDRVLVDRTQIGRRVSKTGFLTSGKNASLRLKLDKRKDESSLRSVRTHDHTHQERASPTAHTPDAR